MGVVLEVKIAGYEAVPGFAQDRTIESVGFLYLDFFRSGGRCRLVQCADTSCKV
jgi:hypothetical protein